MNDFELAIYLHVGCDAGFRDKNSFVAFSNSSYGNELDSFCGLLKLIRSLVGKKVIFINVPKVLYFYFFA